eukprot:1152709-Pelagomonas_calceolata.AAC.1
MQAVKTLPTSTKEMGETLAEAPCVPRPRGKKRSMGIRRLTSSTPCLISPRLGDEKRPSKSSQESSQERVWCSQACKHTGQNEHGVSEQAWWL